MMKRRKVIVVGGGVSGGMASLRAVECGAEVWLVNEAGAVSAASSVERNGVNAALDTAGEGDAPSLHAADTIRCGDFLMHQGPVRAMCEAAPAIVSLLDRMGVAFDRTSEGLLAFTHLAGSSKRRNVLAGARTGQQVLRVIAAQVLRHAAAERVRPFEGWECLSLILDEGGACRGIVAANRRNMELRAIAADAVIVASGGYGGLFGRTSTRPAADGAMTAACFRQGAILGNPEFIQILPYAIAGPRRCHEIGEAILSAGARVSTQRGEGALHLDLTSVDHDWLLSHFADAMDRAGRISGDDPLETPICVVPAVGRSLGGLWVDATHATSIAGLFAAGSCAAIYHGARALPGNELLADLYGGMMAGEKAAEFATGATVHADDLSHAILDAAKIREEDRNTRLAQQEGEENAYALSDEVGEILSSSAFVVREDAKLAAVGKQLAELEERIDRAPLLDRSEWANGELLAMRRIQGRVRLARAIVTAAAARAESRGTHVKPAAPERNDAKWLVTTKASLVDGTIQLDFSEKVEASEMAPGKKDDR